MSVFYKVAKAVIHPFCRWLQPVKVIGKENIPQSGAFIMCSNHTSMSDPIFMITVFKRQVHFMAKSELFRNPIVGGVLKAVGAFPVERGKGDMSAVNLAEDIIRRGDILGIYPEGKRYKEGAPRKAKSGVAHIAMSTNADILPVSVYREGPYSWFKKTTIRIGKVMKYEELYNPELSDRANMKNIVEAVTDSITSLWEMKH